jgi:diguanylate cyclase (GGDEF)-like protein
MRAAVEAMLIPTGSGPASQLTVSIGVVTDAPRAAEDRTFADLREFFRAADEALYVAKREGRNRVVRARAAVTS